MTVRAACLQTVRVAARKKTAKQAGSAKKPRRSRVDPLKRVREICLALPDATEKEAWGAPTFRVRDKLFAHFRDDHHGDGRLAIWCKAPPGTQSILVESDPEIAGIVYHTDAMTSDRVRVLCELPAAPEGATWMARISFQSSNAWDAHGAANFGFRVVWVNRFGQAQERLPGGQEHEITDLSQLPPLLGY